MVAFLRLTILSTAQVIPQFLQVVRGFRAIEVGGTLVWIAAPQFILCVMAGYILRRVDARFVASVGFMFICTACLMVAHTITPVWGSDQFLPSQLPAGRRAKFRPVRNDFLRNIASTAAGRVDLRIRTAGLAPDGRRDRHGVRSDVRAQTHSKSHPTF